MNEHKTSCNALIVGILIITLLSSFLSNRDKLKYLQRPTIALDENRKQLRIISYGDSLYLVKAEKDIPLHYFKNIVSEVCFDKECRLLEITVYWNITGRYLGFELPKGEFLSKYEHEPFVEGEYERLNELLANPNLPLGDISFERLIKLPEKEKEPVDGISGATTPEVSKMVVKGAAYTTYTLWNIVHGNTMDLVASLTEKQLSPDLLNLILRSPDITDRVWALKRIDQNTDLKPVLTSSLLDIISGDDFFLAYSAINAISGTHLNSDSFQINLFSSFERVNHSVKKMIIEKLMEAPYLSSGVVESSRKLLSTLNGQQLGDFLKLYMKFEIGDTETCTSVSEILKNENRFISQKAYYFLMEINTNDQRVKRLMDNYSLKE